MPNVNLMPTNHTWDVFDASDMDEFTDMLSQYGDAAKKVINDTLHQEGAKEIKKEITRLLPASGRNWKDAHADLKTMHSFSIGESTITCTSRMTDPTPRGMWETSSLCTRVLKRLHQRSLTCALVN